MSLISQTGEYAMRAVVLLTERADEGHVEAKSIAKDGKIPEKYLQKILRDLVRAGLLTSTRGFGGGFKLAKPPKRIKLAHVLAPFEPLDEMTRCPFGHAEHGKPKPCPVHSRWQKVTKAYTGFLEGTNLADLVPKAKSPGQRRS